jgi:hypothetical protein
MVLLKARKKHEGGILNLDSDAIDVAVAPAERELKIVGDLLWAS